MESTFSVKSIEAFKFIARMLKNRISNLADYKDREKIFIESSSIQRELHGLIFEKRSNHFTAKEWEELMNELGLTDNLSGFEYNGEKIVFENSRPLLHVYKVRPTFKQGSDGKIINQVIITLIQTAIIANKEFKGVKFRGGCTIIMNLDEELKIEYIIRKSINSKQRFKNQMDYISAGASDQDSSLSMYDDDRLRPSNLSLSKIHSAS